MQVEITLAYGNLEFAAVEEFEDSPLVSGLEQAVYLWREGSFTCDCIRSIWMRQQGAPIAELPCGDRIQLVSLRKFVVH